MLRTLAASALSAVAAAALVSALAGESSQVVHSSTAPRINASDTGELNCSSGDHTVETVALDVSETEAREVVSDIQDLMREGSGWTREIRFATDADCTPTVRHIGADAGGYRKVASLIRSQDWYEPQGRRYLALANFDAPDGACGGAPVLTPDEEESAVAAVWSGCWSRAGLHELLHTLGAVSDNAPHSTGAGHCIDQMDVMCYDDGGPDADQLFMACESVEKVVDCNGDDYFAPDGPAEPWNVAHSPFLTGTEDRSEPVAAAAPQSNDVGGHSLEAHIRWAEAEGIAQGYPDGSFRPNQPITRAQMAAMLHRYHQGQ